MVVKNPSLYPSLYLFNTPSVQALWPWQKHHSTSCHPTLQQISKQRCSPGAYGKGWHPTASSPKTQHLYFYMTYALFLLVKQNKGFLSFQSNKRETKTEREPVRPCNFHTLLMSRCKAHNDSKVLGTQDFYQILSVS